MYWGIVPEHSVYIALPAYKKGQPWGGGGLHKRSTQHISEGPAGSHTSEVDLITGYKISYQTGFFCTLILWLGKTMKPFFYSRQYSYCNKYCKNSKVHDWQEGGIIPREFLTTFFGHWTSQWFPGKVSFLLDYSMYWNSKWNKTGSLVSVTRED